MFSKSSITFVALSVLSVSEQAFGRERWFERDNRPIYLHPRRFGQENPAVLSKLSAACGDGVCATLAGQAISTLLAGADECAQQDLADQIIDSAAQFDATTAANMIALAVEFRQSEKNTPPDFTTNPPTLRNSVFCQTAPKNAQLVGLVQAQDPANNPNVFFDPATKQSVAKGSQANTFPFGTSGASSGSETSVAEASSATAIGGNLAVETDAPSATGSCSLVTVTVSATDAAVTNTAAVTVSVAPAPTATSAADPSAIGDFGSCSIPQIEFGVGFDNRKETSFQPVDKTSYNHGSAQNIDIITQFICDTLVNSCGADQTAKDTCASATAASKAQTPKTGTQADAFNAVFGITTDFTAVAAVDDQGNIIPGTGSDSATPSDAAPTAVVTSPAVAESTVATTATAAPPAVTTTAAVSDGATGVGDFGKCSIPQIEFGVGFDNRKETSFQPVDQTSFNHGSAQDIDIITQFICDTLVNSCGADQAAQDTCASAKAAADTKTAKTGAQADAFNAVFGITTDFSAVAAVDDQGNVVGGAASVTSAANDVITTVASTAIAPSVPAAAATTAAVPGGDASGGNLQEFTGALGGVTPPAVTSIGNGQFQVDGNSAFNNLQNALVRSCDVQHNQCANAANASGNKGDLTVSACGDQQNQCNAQAQ